MVMEYVSEYSNEDSDEDTDEGYDEDTDEGTQGKFQVIIGKSFITDEDSDEDFL